MTYAAALTGKKFEPPSFKSVLTSTSLSSNTQPSSQSKSQRLSLSTNRFSHNKLSDTYRPPKKSSLERRLGTMPLEKKEVKSAQSKKNPNIKSARSRRPKSNGALVRWNEKVVDSVRKAASFRDRIESGQAVIEQIEEAGLKPDLRSFDPIVNTYNQEINLLVKDNKINSAWNLIEEMKEKSLKIDCYTYHPILDHYAKRKDKFNVFSVLKEMEKDSIPLRVITFNSKIKLYLLKGNLEKAQNELKEMKHHSLKPDIFTWTLFLEYFAQKGRTEDRSKVEEIKNNIDEDKFKDLIVYNILIKYFAQINDKERVLELLNEMKKEKVSPQRRTFFPVIEMHLRANNEVEALQVLGMMKKNGCIPNARTYNIFIHWHLSENNILGAKQILERMKKANVGIDITTYNHFIKFHLKKNHEKGAISLLNLMMNEGFQPNKFTYGHFLEFYIGRGEEEKALEKLKSLEDTNEIENTHAYNKMMELYAQKGDIRSFFNMIERMQKFSLKPDKKTYYHMLNLYALLRDEANYFDILDKMKERGFPENRITYGIMMNMYLQKKQMEQVIATFKEMKNKKIVPDIAIYNILLHLCALEGDEKMAETWMAKMRKKGVEPDRETHQQYINLLVSKEKLDEATTYFKTVHFDKKPLERKKHLHYLDLHDFSHGTAYIYLRSYLAKRQVTQPFIIITGKGLHSKLYAMKNYIVEKIQKYHPQLTWRVSNENEGILIVYSSHSEITPEVLNVLDDAQEEEKITDELFVRSEAVAEVDKQETIEQIDIAPSKKIQSPTATPKIVKAKRKRNRHRIQRSGPCKNINRNLAILGVVSLITVAALMVFNGFRKISFFETARSS